MHYFFTLEWVIPLYTVQQIFDVMISKRDGKSESLMLTYVRNIAAKERRLQVGFLSI